MVRDKCSQQAPPSTLQRLRRLLVPVGLGLALSNALVLLVGVGAFGAFWLFHYIWIPAEHHSFRVYLQYPDESSIATGVPLGADVAQLDGPEGGDKVAAGACAQVVLPGLPKSHTLDVDVDLALTAPALAPGQVQPLIMCQADLIASVDGSRVLAASRPLLRPWMPSSSMSSLLWSLFTWPLELLGFVSSSAGRDEIIMPMAEALRVSPQLISSVTHAMVCLRPPPAVYSAELRLRLQLTGVLRLLQRWPKSCCFLCTSAVIVGTWALAGCLMLVFLVRPGAADMDSEEDASAQKRREGGAFVCEGTGDTPLDASSKVSQCAAPGMRSRKGL